MTRKACKKQTAACNRKIKYDDFKKAAAVARRMNRQGHYVSAYQCPICKHYHVGKPYAEKRVKMAFERLDAGRNYASTGL